MGGDEGYARFELTPEKFEMVDGKLFWNDEQRITMLALLLENVGIDAALRLAPLERWREAIDTAQVLPIWPPRNRATPQPA